MNRDHNRDHESSDMPGNVPGVMVSSPYYDLREVRLQLASFLSDELGYRVLISESGPSP